MQIYAFLGYFTNLIERRQLDSKTKEECHKMLMMVGRYVYFFARQGIIVQNILNSCWDIKKLGIRPCLSL